MQASPSAARLPARARGRALVRAREGGAAPILAAVLLLAAAIRLLALGHQSLWYDEAYTPVHVLHPGLGATLRSVVHTENTPPLWYLGEWVVQRLLGDGALALRLLSAVAGIVTVWLAWLIGAELGAGDAVRARRTAMIFALLAAVNPLLVWYSQEARAYSLFIALAAAELLWFLRAERSLSGRALAAWAGWGALALLTHYFAAFLIAPQAVWLLMRAFDPGSRSRRPVLAAVAGVGVVAAALVPLIVAQGGHGTQWIGRWALSSRLQAIPQYFLLGASGAPLGHLVELLLALAVVGAVVWALWRIPEEPVPRAAALSGAIGVLAILIPLLLALLGADYLAPRNLVAAWIPAAGVPAALLGAGRVGRSGPVLAAALAVGFLAVAIDVQASPRLQRGDWHGVARVLGAGRSAARAIVVPELGAAPLEYYLPPLRNLRRGQLAAVREIDLVGYAPLVADPRRSPAPGFALTSVSDVHGLLVERFRSSSTVMVSEVALRRHAINRDRPEVLVPGPGFSRAGIP